MIQVVEREMAGLANSPVQPLLDNITTSNNNDISDPIRTIHLFSGDNCIIKICHVSQSLLTKRSGFFRSAFTFISKAEEDEPIEIREDSLAIQPFLHYLTTGKQHEAITLCADKPVMRTPSIARALHDHALRLILLGDKYECPLSFMWSCMDLMVTTIESLYSGKQAWLSQAERDDFLEKHYRPIVNLLGTYPQRLWPAFLPIARRCVWIRPGYHKHQDEIRLILRDTPALAFFCIDKGCGFEMVELEEEYRGWVAAGRPNRNPLSGKLCPQDHWDKVNWWLREAQPDWEIPAEVQSEGCRESGESRGWALALFRCGDLLKLRKLDPLREEGRRMRWRLDKEMDSLLKKEANAHMEGEVIGFMEETGDDEDILAVWTHRGIVNDS